VLHSIVSYRMWAIPVAIVLVLCALALYLYFVGPEAH
jgi:hypothetical protein